MMYPLVRDLADPTVLLRVPVTVTCRVLGFSTQAFYQWLANPVCQRDWDDAHLINAALDLHGDDPEFGYRLLTGELRLKGVTASENRVWRLCSQQRIFSVHSRKRGLNRKPGPPVHDDLLERDFTAETVNVKWLTDITEHPTAEGKLYLCAVKDCASNKIVGYFPGRPDDLRAGRHRPAQRDRHPLTRRHPRALRPRQPVPVAQVRPGPATGRPDGLDGARRGA